MSEVKFIISLDSRAFKSGSEDVKAQVRRITEEVKTKVQMSGERKTC